MPQSKMLYGSLKYPPSGGFTTPNLYTKMVFTALPEVLRGMATIQGLPVWLAQFLRDGRLIIFGLLIVLGTIFFPQGLVTPELLKRWKKGDRGSV